MLAGAGAFRQHGSCSYDEGSGGLDWCWKHNEISGMSFAVFRTAW